MQSPIEKLKGTGISYQRSILAQECEDVGAFGYEASVRGDTELHYEEP